MNRIMMTVGLLCSSVIALGQTVSPVDFMRLNPYQLNSNPAADLPYRSVLMLVLGDGNYNIQNTGLHYDNLFEFDAQGKPTMVDLRKFADGMHPKNDLGFEFNQNLFFLCRKVGDGMFSVGYNIHLGADLEYNDGLFKLLAYGNGAFVGEEHPAVIDMNLNVKAYREIALGYQHNITDQLSIGGRAKLLFGFANIKTDVCQAKLVTDADSYALRLYENVAVSASLPLKLAFEEGSLRPQGMLSVADLFRNPGFAVDLGAEYRFNEQFGVVAAINDLGFIRWSGNNYQLSSQIADAGQYYDEGSVFFQGMSVDEIQQIASDALYREQFLDTLKRYFQLDFDQRKAYNTMLNANCLLRGYFDVNPSNRFAAQAQGYWTGHGFRPAFTLAYCGSFWNCLSVCATYTAMRNSYNNFGLGLGASLGAFHIYAATNNIIGFIDPVNSNGINAQAGIVFNLR